MSRNKTLHIDAWVSCYFHSYKIKLNWDVETFRWLMDRQFRIPVHSWNLQNFQSFLETRTISAFLRRGVAYDLDLKKIEKRGIDESFN